ncbi:MAG: HAMP domain-containing protein, partial [Acidimicrobiia bacterium]|nr:HAMP domain-containing protein [Acidimicrobiia bacterium]
MSLRARLLVAMTVIAVVLVTAAFAVTRATRDNLVDRVDDELKASIGRVEEDLGPGPGSRRGFSELYAEVVTRRGARVVLLAPENLDAPIRPDLDIDEIRAAANDESFTSGAIDGSGASVSKRFRVLVAGDRSGAALMIALPLDQVDASMSRLITLEVIVTIVVLGVLALVAWWVVRLGIRPVKQMATAASAIGAGDLSHRVPEATAGTEVGDLGVALNNMLGQIETSFDNQRRSEERLRQFVADASHELRTPVATVRGYAELYRSGGLDDPSQLDEAMRRSEQEAIR